ncbi:MAG: 1-acyl-sn-glycerol-3-phosphate acyltransferase [Trueperaceae bacterium]|nr:1-acyl-sn-glycerol-3-phosphate acyltransferase [Trueperaceae bacterium]
MRGASPADRVWGGVRNAVRRQVRFGIEAALPTLVRRSLRRDLAGTWGRGDVAALAPSAPDGPGVLVAANHHAWWDGYLAWVLARRAGRPLALLMNDAQFDRFPFFGAYGVVPVRHARTFARRVADGALGIVFVEGGLRPAGPVEAVEPGAARLARATGVPLHPLAIRVTLRGLQRPEAYLSLGGPVAAEDGAVRDALNAELADVDARLRATDPETIPSAFTLWAPGRGSPDRAARGFERWWT